MKAGDTHNDKYWFQKAIVRTFLWQTNFSCPSLSLFSFSAVLVSCSHSRNDWKWHLQFGIWSWFEVSITHQIHLELRNRIQFFSFPARNKWSLPLSPCSFSSFISRCWRIFFFLQQTLTDGSKGRKAVNYFQTWFQISPCVLHTSALFKERERERSRRHEFRF